MTLELDGMAPLLQVFDMPTAIAFYRDRLGFEIVESSPPRRPDDFDWALVRLGPIDLMLNTAYEEHERPAEPDPSRVEAHRDTTLFFGCPDVDTAYDHLRNQGVRIEPPTVTPYGMKQLYLRDPDGYLLCFQWRV